MKRGTIVLAPFPFTDLSSQKVRPALVVSRSNRPGNDVILAFITSGVRAQSLPSDLQVLSSNLGFSATGLKRDSVVKLDKLVTVDQGILLGALGELQANLMQQADEKLRYALEL